MADPLQGLPGGDPQQTVPIVVSREITFTNFALMDVQPLPDGGTQVTFVVPQTGEVFHWPLSEDAASKLGKQLLAPRVALPSGNGDGLRAI